MVAVPGVTPVTIPEEKPIVALALVLLHVPPVDASLKVILKPGHTLKLAPVMDGTALTTFTVVVE